MVRLTLLKILLAEFAIMLGGFVYILFRPKEILFISWIRRGRFEDIYEKIRAFDIGQADSLPEWFIYSTPDGLWAFAYALIITTIWHNKRSSHKLFWMISIPLLTLGMEFLQYAVIIAGTFCPIDMAANLLGISMGYIFGKASFK